MNSIDNGNGFYCPHSINEPLMTARRNDHQTPKFWYGTCSMLIWIVVLDQSASPLFFWEMVWNIFFQTHRPTFYLFEGISGDIPCRKRPIWNGWFCECDWVDILSSQRFAISCAPANHPAVRAFGSSVFWDTLLAGKETHIVAHLVEELINKSLHTGGMISICMAEDTAANLSRFNLEKIKISENNFSFIAKTQRVLAIFSVWQRVQVEWQFLVASKGCHLLQTYKWAPQDLFASLFWV